MEIWNWTSLRLNARPWLTRLIVYINQVAVYYFFLFNLCFFLGWCGSNGTCVAGSGAGPFEPCVKGAYIFAKPKPNFQPNARIVNENVGGVKLTVITK